MPPDEPRGGAGASDDALWIETWLRRAQRRWWAGLVAWHVVVGLVSACAVRACIAGAGGGVSLLPGAVAGVCTTLAAVLAARGVRSLQPLLVAVESRTPSLGNGLLAWHELGTAVEPGIKAHLARHVRASLASTRVPPPVSLRAWTVTILAQIAVIAVPLGLSVQTSGRVGMDGPGPAAASGGVPLHWRVRVQPPAYTRVPPQDLSAPTQIEALEGSRLQFRFEGWPEGAQLRRGEEAIGVRAIGPDSREAIVEVRQSDVLIVSTVDARALATVVIVARADSAPDVRITVPGADLRRAAPTGQVTIRAVARDDLGVRELRLRFTRVSGSGESFTFEDGEWPIRVGRRSATEWEGEYVLDLASAGLGPGDSIAYHAVAHDARPGSVGAGESERYLIEIAREGAQAAGDFSLPEPEEKFALSQRMVILLTERLLERRPRMSAAAYLGEAQALAIAQRRVRAEFVFMLGGEVEDEVEEAAHSHEIEAGRLDNFGQDDLTTAVRQMAQAESRLTDGNLREALPYEYRALAALQAAFGKARYFMRTLPTPVQLDGSRRLQGDRSEASPARWAAEPFIDAQRREAVALLGRLEVPGVSWSTLLPALVALDRTDPDWVRSVRGAAETSDVAEAARLVRTRLLASSPARLVVPLPSSSDEAALAALERRP